MDVLKEYMDFHAGFYEVFWDLEIQYGDLVGGQTCC